MPMDVAAFFEQRVGVPPTLVARAPGRVNLLGEHTDYNDLPVLPMAIQRRVCVAIRPRSDGLVVLQNVDPRFSPVEFEILPGIPPHGAGHWGNYAKAPADELARRFRIRRGFEGILASDIPVAAGLSSSSAIVTAVGLALAHINEIGLEVRAFAELMAEAERRYTGTRGGSMDQTISLAASAGCATRLTFRPPTSQHVPVPREWRFIIADT
ncbi:MAG TPA: galactokinase family protein, partial [Longimicrobiales bacterium]|nr:galactokinase family protein [Longimicrobiales bacterium]